MARLIETGNHYADSVNGIFDLSIMPVKVVWGLFDTTRQFPDSAALSAARDKVDYRRIRVRGQRVCFASRETEIDVGGIAKGAVLQAVVRLLRESGYSDFLVVAGGDICSSGERAGGGPWRIGIQHPRRTDALLAALPLDSGTVVTSGDYERYRMQNGLRHHHIFNPHTARSCRNHISLTLWGMDPVEVDILSTALFCFPPDSLHHFIESRPRLEGLAVDRRGRIWVSSGWKEKVSLRDSMVISP